LSDANFNKLLNAVDELSDEAKSRVYEDGVLNNRDRTVSDVLCHLHEWHLMMKKWYGVGMSGEKPIIPAEGFTWKTLPLLNQQIRERYAGTSLSDAIAMFKDSHTTMMSIIQKHTDDELFTKKHYKWTGTTSLAAYLISATSSHYDWGWKCVRKAGKTIALTSNPFTH
jgi:hypothetical protein